METDKRKSARLSPLVIRAEFEHAGKPEKGYLTNLSESGAFLATDVRPERGNEIELNISLPWRLGDLTAKASVVWLTGEQVAEEDLPQGVGLTFVELTPEAREKIRLYMQKFYGLIAQIHSLGVEQAFAALSEDGMSRDETAG